MVTVTVLGEQSVVDPGTGRTVTRSARSLALIGLLVSRAGAPVTRAWIAGAFWPDSGDRQALTNLRREVHQLRQLVPDDTLEVTPSQLCWHDRGRHDVDLAAFLREAEAATLATADAEVVAHGAAGLSAYGGDLLPGLDEDWASEARDQLRGRCAALCDRVAEAAERLDRLDEAVAALRRRVGLDGYDEPAHRRLMELQAAAGDRAGAVRTYHRLAGRLELDLGVRPDPETVTLLRRLTRPSAPRPGGTADVGRRGPAGSGLIGRRAEMQALVQAWRTARAGRAGVVLVRGAAGVGKSRLVAELAAGVETDRGLVGRARCFDSSGRVSLAPVAEWLRSPAVRAGRARLDPVWAREVGRLLPTDDDEAGARDGRDAGPLDLSQQHRFFEGLARSLLAVDRPTLLVLDNLQWCDADTLSFTSLLLSLAPRASLLLVAITRDDVAEANPEAGRWLDRLRSGGGLTEVDLDPLGAADTARLAAGLGGPALTRADLALLHEATGGFPLYIVESLRAGAAPAGAPDATEPWADVLQRRLRATSPAAQQVAQLAAALGRDFTLPLLVEASELPPDSVVLAVDELWRTRILLDQREGYDFSHDLLREAAYSLVSPPRRWLLHRRLAEALVTLHGPEPEAWAAPLADQYRLAGDHDRAADLYEHAAQAAERVFAHAEARRLIRLALEQLGQTPDSAERDRRELAMQTTASPVLLALGGWTSPELEAAVGRVIELSLRRSRPDVLISARNSMYAVNFVNGRIRQADRIAERAIDSTVTSGIGGEHSFYMRGGTLLHLGRCDEAYESFTRALEWEDDSRFLVGLRTQTFSRGWWAHASWATARPEQAVELARDAVRLTRDGDDANVPSRVISLVYGAVTWCLLGDRDTCGSWAAQALELCRRNSLGYYSDLARVLDGWARGDAGDLAAAIADLRALRAEARMPLWLMLLADVTADPADHPALLAQAEAVIERTEERLWLPEVWRRQAAYLPDDGARDRLDRAEGLAIEQGNRAYAARCAADRAERFANATPPSVPAPLPAHPQEPS